MSTTIEEQVVAMRFDNKNFEKNVQTSMSTLDKFKAKLNFKGMSKGLEDVEKSAKKVDLSPMSKSAEQVGLKFNAMYTIADQAMRNITNSAMAAGKKIINAFTIDPVKTGFQEYETQINAVQTILANTKSKGTTIDDVNAALEELNKYADMTIYNFTEMTRNIGTFTAAGVDLDTSTNAIKGIANLAAVSGSTSQQASTAMYQLSQALSSGVVKLMDWNSVTNAGMGGQVFQDALKETARVHGVAIDEMIESEGSFRETLSQGWLTSDILTETLEKFTMTTEGLTDAQIEQNRQMLKAKGYTDEQIEAIFELGRTATDAATKVKTFTQLWDVLKEAAQSGWSQTWKLIVGDFEEAKALLTPLANTLTGFINKMSDARNRVVQIALDFASPWKFIVDKVGNVKKAIKPLEKVIGTLEDFQNVVDRVWMGDFGNVGGSPDRRDLLKAAGYDPRVVQELVNLGEESWHSGKVYKLSTEQVEAAHAKFGLTMENTKEETEETTAAFEKLTDKQLENAGLTEDEISLYRALETEADRLGISVGELADEMSNTNGRDLLIESFKNIGDIFVGTGKAAKEAWNEIFNPPSLEVLGIRLYGVIRSLKDFSESLRLTDKETGKLNENGQKLARTFKGVFAVFDIVLTVIGGPIKIAFKILSQLLGVFGFNILDVTACVGDMLVKLRDFIDGALDFTGVFEAMVEPVKKGITAFRDWIASLKESKNLPQDIANGIVNGFGKMFGFVRNMFSKLVDGFSGAPSDMIAGFANGIWNGMQIAGQVMVELGKKILEKFREVLGIHSPSTETAEDGKNFGLGFIEGLKEVAGKVWSTIKEFGGKCVDILKKIDFGSVITGLLSAGVTVAMYKFSDGFQALSEPLEGVSDLLTDTGKGVYKTLKGFGKMMSGIGTKFRGEGIKDMAIALVLLVGAIALLTLLDPQKVVMAVVVIATLAAVLDRLSQSSGKFDKDAAFNTAKIVLSMVGIAAAVLILAIAMKKFANLDFENNWVSIIGGMTLAVGSLAGLMYILGRFVKGKTAQNIDKAGITILKMAAAMLLMAFVVKIMGGIDTATLIQGGITVLAFGGIMVGLVALTKLAGKKIDQVGIAISKMAGAMLLMAITVGILGRMDINTLIQGGIAIVAFGGIIVGLVAATKLASDKDISSASKMITSVGVAMLLMSLTAKIMGGMEPGPLAKGLIAITAFGGIIVGLVAATKLASDKELKRVGTTLLMMSISIGIMALVAAMLGMLSLGHLAKGVTAVAILGVLISTMIKATKDSQKCVANIVAMTVAITLMTVAIAALSFLPLDKLATSTGALALLMGMFALMLKSVKGVDNKALIPLITLTVVVGLLAGIVWGLSLIDAPKALQSTIILVALMTAVTVLLKVLSGIGGQVSSALKGIGSLALMAVLLMGFVAIIHFMPDISKQEDNVILLTAFMTAMTALLAVLSVIGLLIGATGGMPLFGIVGLIAMVIPLMEFVALIHFMPDISSKTGSIDVLLPVMTTMTNLLIKLSLVAPLLAIAIPAIYGLIGVVTAFGALVLGIGALMTEFPKLEEFLNKGIPVMVQLASGLGSMIGAFVTAIATSVMTLIPTFAIMLSMFMANIQPFIQLSKNIDADLVKRIAYLSAAILLLSVADFISGILTIGGLGLVGLGLELSAFGIAIQPFLDIVSNVDESSMKAVKNLAETILILTAADVMNGLTAWLTGGSSFASFGEDLKPLGEGLKSFGESVKDWTPETAEKVNLACEAIKFLAEAAEKIPNEGGWAGKIFGENGIGAFADKLPDVGTNLGKFATNLADNGFTSNTASLIEEAANSLSALAGVKIENEGGAWSDFWGDNSLSTFASNLGIVGSGISSFCWYMSNSNVTTDALDKAEVASEAIAALAGIELPNGNGKWQEFWGGTTTLESFCDQLPSVGESLASFVSEVGTFDNGTTNVVIRATNLFKSLATLSASDLKSLKTVGKDLESFGKKFKSFVDKVNEAGSDSVITACKSVTTVVNTIKDIDTTITDSASAFTDALEKLAEDGVDKFIKVFATANVDATETINTFITKTANDVKTGTNKDKFKSVGEYLMEGFAAGITNNQSLVTTAIENACKAALTTAQTTLQIQSPSVVFNKEVGRWIVEGIAEGIDKNTSAEEAIEKKASNLVSAFRDKLDELNRVTDKNDLDYQLWEAKNSGLGDAVKSAKQLETLTKNLTTVTEKTKVAHDKYTNAVGEFGENSKYAKEAWNEYLQAAIDEQNLINEISDTKKNSVKTLEELTRENEDLNYELWKERYPDATLSAQHSRELVYLDDRREDLNRDVAELQSEYDKLLDDSNYGPNHADTIAKGNELISKQIELQGVNNRITEIQDESVQDRIDSARALRDEMKEAADIEYETWTLNNPKATDVEKDAAEIKRLTTYRIETGKETLALLKEYKKIQMDENATQADILEAKNAYEASLNEEKSIDKQIADIQEAALEREANNLENQRKLMSDIAQLKYDIWEETYGRDAKDEEKDAKKLEMLNEQAIIQAQLLATAQQEYNKVLKETGDASSNEALQAQSDLLNAQLALARLKGQILDIEEDAADRQKKLQDKQRIAQSDYKEYIKKYKKYYLENGMTLEDLERDAKLVSGYDPTAAINKVISKNSPEQTINKTLSEASKTLKNIESDTTYKEIVENLGEMGSSYVTAISEGMTTNMSIITNTVTSIVDNCIKTMEKRYSSWKDAGVYLVNGFIRGINSRVTAAANAAASMAYAASSAAEKALKINSPSKVFERMGMYVDMGLAQGIRKYTGLAETETTDMGNTVIDRFRNTVSQIADAINSDIDTQPTIRPVLDLSNVESGTARLNAMFSRSQALTASAGIAANRSAQNQNGNTGESESGTTWNFTQNNYSPKALSPAEIYRQTRNQFAAMKEALNK